MPDEKKIPYLSDRWALEDALNFDTFQPALVQILEQAETPLTIGIFGTWGTGKTTLLHMLESAIQNKKLAYLKSIWFTAWKYEKGEALWRAFLLRVIDSLYPKKDDGSRYLLEELKDKNQQTGAQKLELLERSIYETINWQEEGKWSIDVGELAKQGLRIPIWLALHLAGLGEVGKDLGIKPDLIAIIEKEVREHHLNQLISMEQFEKTFQEVIQMILGKDGRLLIFVDDLDRCLPEKAIEILEAIKLFLDVPGTIFIIGMDREIIRRGIESHYRAIFQGDEFEKNDIPINGDVYLQKMIQLHFNLPSLDLKSRFEYIQKLEKTIPTDFYLEDITKDVFAHGLYPNPRQVKRAMNVFFLLKNIAQEQENQGLIPKNVLAWPLLAKTVLIQSQWPELYLQWRQYPTLIQTLEEEYTRQPILEDELLRGFRNSEDIDSAMIHISDQSTDDTPQRPNENRMPATGLLAPFLNERQKYALLADLLRYPEISEEGCLRGHFSGLTRKQLQMYIGLVGTLDQTIEPVATAAIRIDNISQELQSGDLVRIHEVVAMINEKEADQRGSQHLDLTKRLLEVTQSASISPIARAVAADTLDELGWLPDDLAAFVPITLEKPEFYIARYPVTNAQYARFLEAFDFRNEEYWLDFPLFGAPKEKYQLLDKTSDDEGLQWLEKNWDENKKIFPRNWKDPRFGIARKGAPVVGITWYEANAYCRWLQEHWNDLDEKLHNPSLTPRLARLPTEAEWIAAAGGDKPAERFPWDLPHKATSELKSDDDPHLADILWRANVAESGIRRTTPVWMYQTGKSTLGVVDMAGNTWEWQASYRDKYHELMTLRGGSWYYSLKFAILSARNYAMPRRYWSHRGFRVLVLSN